MAIILHYSTEFGSFRKFGANYIKEVEDRLQQKCNPKNLVLSIYDLWRYSQRFLQMNFRYREAFSVKSDKLIID